MQKKPVRYLPEYNLRFLAEVSKIFNSSLDYTRTLTSVATLIVSYIADFSIIDLIDANGLIYRVAVADADSQKIKIAQEMHKYPPDPEVEGAIYEVARTGKPILIKKATKEWLSSVAHPEEKRIIHKLGLNSHIFVPLISRGRTIGVLTFASRSKNPFTQSDLILAEELASRAAVAVDNARLYHEAREAIRSRDEFLSIASHELKTPLTSILLQLQIVLKGVQKTSKESKSNQQLLSLLQNTEQQSKKLSKLINDLLNISVISTGRLQLDREKVDFSSVIDETLQRFHEQLKRAKYKVKVTMQQDIIGYWDRTRIEQVISNLIANAIKYGQGKPIKLELKRLNSHAQFTIQDHGIGIEPNFQNQIFERFARGVSARDYRGLGVGLYISRQIIEAHGGSIRLKSKPQEGSKFIIELPLLNRR